MATAPHSPAMPVFVHVKRSGCSTGNQVQILDLERVFLETSTSAKAKPPPKCGAHASCIFNVWILGFGFWGLGSGFWILGLGFWVSGFGVWVLGWGVRGGGCKVWGVGCGVWGVGCGVLSVGCKIEGLGFRVEGENQLFRV